MVVAIISMAQQARPKVSGQTEFLRPQLYSSSKEVAKIPCLLNSFFRSWSIETSSRPRQHTFLAGPDQTLHQQEQENQHSQASRQRKAGEGRGERQQKDGLHVEDQKNDGIQIIRDVQPDPRVPFGFESAFIGGMLL